MPMHLSCMTPFHEQSASEKSRLGSLRQRQKENAGPRGTVSLARVKVSAVVPRSRPNGQLMETELHSECAYVKHDEALCKDRRLFSCSTSTRKHTPSFGTVSGHDLPFSLKMSRHPLSGLMSAPRHILPPPPCNTASPRPSCGPLHAETLALRRLRRLTTWEPYTTALVWIALNLVKSASDSEIGCEIVSLAAEDSARRLDTCPKLNGDWTCKLKRISK